VEAKGHVLKTTQTATDFELLLRTITHESCYVIAQQVDSIRFEAFDPSMSLLELLQKGRIFNRDFEIRYEKLDGGNYELMVFFEEEDKIGCLNISGTVAEYEVSRGLDDIFLWGTAKNIEKIEKMENRWGFIELQIPQILKYPEIDGLRLSDGNELVIKAFDYIKDGFPCFTRFRGVEKHDASGK
jgi:hypothetical protein